MEQKLTFTAYLKDEYSKRFDKLADHSDESLKKIVKDLDKLSTTGKRAVRTIDEIDKRIRVLSQAKKLTVDTSEIKFASAEIKALQREKDKLEGSSSSGGGGMFGGMGKGFAVAGSISAVGYALKEVAGKAIDATVKYQNYEAVLTTSFGNSGKAKAAMDNIIGFAATTPFQVDELTQAYVRLRNRGFNPTLETLTSIGDLAASQGKDFMQVTEAILDAPQKQFIRLQEALGVDVQTLTKTNQLKFVGLGQTKIIKDDPEEIKKTVLEFAKMKGIMGSMNSISKTTGGQLSNLEDNFDILYKTIGDRFKPEIDSTVTSISSMVATVKTWFDIPTSKKLQDETDHLAVLRTELGFSNTSEQRRKEILEEVKRIQPDIIDGTKSEKEQMEGLTDSLDKYINKRKEQIAFQKVTEKYADNILGFNKAKAGEADAQGRELEAIAQANRLGFKSDGMTQGQASVNAQKFLQSRIAKGIRTDVQTKGFAGGASSSMSAEERALVDIQHAVILSKNANAEVAKNSASYNEAMAAQANIKALLGTSAGTDSLGGKTDGSGKPTGGDASGGKGSSSSSTAMGSISGGSKITHLNITIGNLVGGGVNIHSSTVKEGAMKMTDHVKEALLTAVNDANLAAASNK
jgi:hypothetical protein